MSKDYDRKVRVGDIFLVNGKKYLVGDINCLGGVCDDCCEFSVYDTDNQIIDNIFDNPTALIDLLATDHAESESTSDASNQSSNQRKK